MSETDLGRYRPYPEYKDSGVEWLGEIPEHWKTFRLKNALSLSKEKNGDQPVGQMLSVSGYRGIEPKKYESSELIRTDEELVDYRVVRVGQLVANTMWLNYAGLGVSAYEGHVSPAYRCYNIDTHFDGSYLHHLMRSGTYVGRYTSLLYGIRPNSLQIKNHDWDSIELLIPPLPEQRSIAAFLDRETARIDELIAHKQRLIELLQEKHSALITQAVTQGLDPDVEMKDSGVEWLGRVPVGWEVARIGLIAKVGNGSTPKRENSAYWQDGAFPWLTSTKINDEIIYEADQLVTSTALQECHLPIVEADSVLMAITGEGQTRGRAALLKTSATISQHLAYISPDDRLGSEYLWRFLQSQYKFLRHESSGTGSTRAAITCDYIKSYPILIPPPDEQERIVKHLTNEEEYQTSLVSKTQLAIDHLNEYRTALISAAVTGKIDVRDPSPTLPSQGRETTVGRGWGEKRPA